MKISDILDYFGEEVLPGMLGIIILISFAIYTLKPFLSDQEKLSLDGTGILVIETKYPFGSIFNKDSIKITGNTIIFYKKNFFQNKEISLPNSKIERIVFVDGLFWDSITIKPQGFLVADYTIYTRYDETRKRLKDVISALDLEIVEQDTIWDNLLSDYLNNLYPNWRKSFIGQQKS